jgi:hypothetical protein
MVFRVFFRRTGFQPVIRHHTVTRQVENLSYAKNCFSRKGKGRRAKGEKNLFLLSPLPPLPSVALVLGRCCREGLFIISFVRLARSGHRPMVGRDGGFV